MTWRARRSAAVLLVGYSVLLVVALIAPTSTTQSSMVRAVVDALVRSGASASLVTFGRAEVVMNALIVAPVSFLGSIVGRRLSWRDWTALGFCFSVAVELVQGVLLPDRQASFSDIVANTMGALLGALVALVLRRRSSGCADRDVRSAGV